MTNIDHLVALVAAAPPVPDWFMPLEPPQSPSADGNSLGQRGRLAGSSFYVWADLPKDYPMQRLLKWHLHWAKEQLKAIQAECETDVFSYMSDPAMSAIHQPNRPVSNQAASYYHGIINDLEQKLAKAGENKEIKWPLNRYDPLGLGADQYLHIIEHLEAKVHRNAGKWIPITEQEPPDHCTFLMTDGDKVDIGWMHGGTTPYHVGVHLLMQPFPLTHWMPLPPPPVKL